MTDEIAGIGHNLPPTPIDLKTGHELADELAASNHDLLTRQMELLDGVTRAPESIDDDEVSGRMAAFLTQLNGFVKHADAERQKRKEPYLSGGRVVDGFFSQLMLPIQKAFTTLNSRQTAYGQAKAAKIRREAEERQRLEREEAARKQREAEKAERDRKAAEREARKAVDETARVEAEARAKEAQDRADAARKAQDEANAQAGAAAKTANASDAELSRVRGDMAGMSIRTNMDWELVDITKVPPEFLEVNARMVKAAISGKNGKRDIPGLRIFESKQAVNR